MKGAQKRWTPDWAVLLSAAGFTIWGFSLLLTRVGQRYASPMVLLSIRFLLAFALLNIPLLLGREKLRLRGKNLRPLAVLGVLEPLCFVFESYAIYFTNATITGVVSALSPIAAMVLSAVILREYPTRRQALFSLLPVAGVILLTAAGQEVGALSWIGIPFLLGYSVCSGYFKVANRSAADFSPYERTYALLLSCAAFYGGGAGGMQGRPDRLRCADAAAGPLGRGGTAERILLHRRQYAGELRRGAHQRHQNVGHRQHQHGGIRLCGRGIPARAVHIGHAAGRGAGADRRTAGDEAAGIKETTCTSFV